MGAAGRRNHPAKRTMLGGLEAPAQQLTASPLGKPQVRVSAQSGGPTPPPGATPAVKAEPEAPKAEDGKAQKPETTKPGGAKPGEAPDWVVAINDRDHTEMSTRQLVELYAIGAVTARTFVWKRGMDAWKTPFDVPEIADALKGRGFERPAGTEGLLPNREVPSYDEDGALSVPPPVSKKPDSAWQEPARAVGGVPSRPGVNLAPASTGPASGAAPGSRGPSSLAPMSSAGPVSRQSLASASDDVTVAIDTRKLLAQVDRDAARLKLPSGRPEDDDEGSSRPGAPLPAAGSPAIPAPASKAPSVSSGSGPLSAPMSEEPTVHVNDVDRLLDVPASHPAGSAAAGGKPITGEGAAHSVPVAGGFSKPPDHRADRSTDTAPPQRRPEGLGARPSVAGLEPEPKSSPLFTILLVVMVPVLVILALYAYDPNLLARLIPPVRDAAPWLFPAPASQTTAAPTTTVAQAVPAVKKPAGFDRGAAQVALGLAAKDASACALDPGSKSLDGTVVVTFEPRGSVGTVDITGSLRGTKTAECVAQHFQKVKVDAFDGPSVVIARQISIP
jgi:hypothetical protein